MKNVFGNLRLAAKLGLGFGICLTLALGVGLSAISSMGKMNQAATNMSKDSDAERGVSTLNIDLLQYVRSAKNLMIAETESERVRYSEDISKAIKTVDQDFDDFKAVLYTDMAKKVQADLLGKWKEFQPYNQKLVTLALEGKRQEAQKASLEGKALLDDIEKGIDDFRSLKKKQGAEKKEAAAAAAASATKTTFMLLSTAIILGILVSLYLTKSITGTLRVISTKFTSIKENDVNQLTSGLQALASGDLTVPAQAITDPIELNTKDEFGQMAQTFDSMLIDLRGAVLSYGQARESLTQLVRELAENSASVAATSQTLAAASEESGAAASEIASGSDKLAQSASDSAAIVEELIAHVSTVSNSSLQQMELVKQSGGTLDDAASGIAEVATSAQHMASAASEGDRAVTETVEAMTRVQETVALSASKVKDLDQKGQQIGNIVGAIEQIAEQTNLLALNAAIEAARAGEHGRGFAVVADEVRKLAEQSSSATKEIADLIGSVKATVDETVKAIEGTTAEAQVGTERSEQAGKALKAILSSAEQVALQAESVASLTQAATSSMGAMSQAAQENATASSEMSTGAERVGTSITNVAAVSEESAAGAEELSASIEEVSAAASELARMSQDLENIVGRFRVENERGGKRPSLKVAA
ncbi:MAG: hypothetical protein BGO01_18635 [Armatimonadetes bacterium 55-13]|nr:MAG: hypothetical protein BGO01_18635 [Armatimonadetes bacterium 55-13]